MPRLTQSVPKYRLHRQSRQAIVTINGRDHLLGPHGTKASKIEYDRLVSEWLASGHSASYGAPQRDYTIVELIADYMRYANRYYGDDPRGSAAAMMYAVRPLKALYGRTAAAEFGPLQFQGSSAVADERRRVAFLRQPDDAKDRGRVSLGGREGKIPASIPQSISMVPGLRSGKTDLRETKLIQPVDEATVDFTIPHVSPVIADMIRLQRLTGARPAEVCILRPCDFDRKRRTRLDGRPVDQHRRWDRGCHEAPCKLYVAMQNKLRGMEQGATRTADKASRELANLAPASIPFGQIQADLLNLAVRRRVTPEKAKEVSGALLGAGYDYKTTMADGGAGDAVLRTLAATNASGKDVDAKSLVDAMTGHMAATGQSKSTANLAAAGKTAQALFASTKLEITDLEQLAEASAVIEQATGLKNEQMALLSQFKDKVPASIGTTAMRGSIGRLLNAGNVRSSRAALKELGHVDLNGESFYDVQDRLGGAFERAGPNAARLGYQLFGNEAVLAQSVLFSKEGAALTQERLKSSADTSAFNRSANNTEGGYEAKENAADSEEVRRFLAHGDYVDPEIARKALMNRIKEAGGGTFSQIMGTKAYDLSLASPGGTPTQQLVWACAGPAAAPRWPSRSLMPPEPRR